MPLLSTARSRRLLFVVVVMVVLSLPLVSTLVTRVRVERQGVDVDAYVVEATRRGDSYLVAFRFPEEIDPDGLRFSAEVERATYVRAEETDRVTVRVLEDRPEAHRVEGEVNSRAPFVVVVVLEALVLLVGLWWVRVGRRRPDVRIRATAPLEPAGPDEVGTLARAPGGDVYEVVGTVISSEAGEVVLDVGERRVVVALDDHPNPVGVGAHARVRGPVIG